ncbi:zinc finger protein 233-like isoform X1 [Artemia franciscana]|uniref:zinc finger protein 233-like isoform X1 n=1 Tax=Artemia franciscana TaxID=6661 RepID=UPI0032DBC21A
MDTPNVFGITAVKQEIEDPLPNDDKSLFGYTNPILLPVEGSNLVNFFQDISTKLEPNSNPVKPEPNADVDCEPKDESSNNNKCIFPLLSMKHDDSLLASSSATFADCKPSSGHLKIESQSGEDKDNPRSHTVKKPFECDMCRKCFPTNSLLIRHQTTHSGEKPFKRDMCDKTFRVKCNLSSHRRTHTGEKPFKCDMCDKTFCKNSHLTYHRRSHTGEKPFKCDVCDKTFDQKSNLSKHQVTHTEEKPFKCLTCQKAFRQKSHLSDHQRIHTGEKPYKCLTCQKAFRQISHLSDHQRIHTRK